MTIKVKKIVEHLARLPGIGPRQALRLTLAMAEWHETELNDLAGSLSSLKNGAIFCRECFGLTENYELCQICSNPRREHYRIAVVEKVTDMTSLEKSGHYKGLYHVLGGAISPAYGMTPDRLRIGELIDRAKRLKNNHLEGEIILATNPNTHGETTAIYLEQELRPLGLKTTRLARGLSTGSSLEYADAITLGNALKHRK